MSSKQNSEKQRASAQVESISRLPSATVGGDQSPFESQARGASPNQPIKRPRGRPRKQVAMVALKPVPILQPVTAGGSQKNHDTQSTYAPSSQSTKVKRGQDAGEHQTPSAPLDHVINTIKEQWHIRQCWHRSEKAHTLQIKDLCRWLCHGDKEEANRLYACLEKPKDHPLKAAALVACLPHFEARDRLEQHRKKVEATLERQAELLPVKSFVENTRGFGFLGLAGIVGESGLCSCDAKAPAKDGNYPNPAKLWKRMGLAVIEGQRQQRISGDKDLAIKHGYSPERRAVIWTIVDSMMKSNLSSTYNEETGELLERKAKGHYGQVYIEYRAKDEAKDHSAQAAVIIEQMKRKAKATGDKLKIPPCLLESKLTPRHYDNRAKRYVGKALLLDLWRAWREATRFLSTKSGVPPAVPIAAE